MKKNLTTLLLTLLMSMGAWAKPMNSIFNKYIKNL